MVAIFLILFIVFILGAIAIFVGGVFFNMFNFWGWDILIYVCLGIGVFFGYLHDAAKAEKKRYKRISIPEKPDPEENKKFIANLYNIATKDGKVTKDEKLMIAAIMKGRGMDEATINAQMEAFSVNPPVKVEIPTNTNDRLTLLMGLVGVLLVDGRATKQEKEFAKDIAVKIGFTESEAEKHVEKIIKNWRNDSSYQKARADIQQQAAKQ